MSVKEEFIIKIFEIDKHNEYDVYAVWLNINGIWQCILLDDMFPCKISKVTGKPKLAYSRSNGPELWVILAEKAYAKAYGSYLAILGGDPMHALKDLTGAPYKHYFDLYETEKVKHAMLKAMDK